MAQHISQRGTGARAHVLFFQYSLRRAHQFNVLEKILDELKAAKYLSVSVDSIVLQTDLQLISVDSIVLQTDVNQLIGILWYVLQSGPVKGLVVAFIVDKSCRCHNGFALPADLDPHPPPPTPTLPYISASRYVPLPRK